MRKTNMPLLVNQGQLRSRSEAGDTLVEILVALVVIGITAIALLTAFATAITSSSEHRNLANNNIALWSVAETAFSQIQQYASNNNNFNTSCAANYSGNFGADPTKYTVTIGPVLYWDSSQTPPFSSYCTSPSYVPQEIPVKVTSVLNGSSDSTEIVVGHFP